MSLDKNYIKVNNDLLASKALSSTQKLFISFVIGWQKNKLVCRMTNNNLATHFGMKYAGIRTLLNTLNKLPFFETTQYGQTKKDTGWSSGHELRVDEEELRKFLNAGKSDAEAPLIEPEFPISNEENKVFDNKSNTSDNQISVDEKKSTDNLDAGNEEYEVEINHEEDTISSTDYIRIFVAKLNGEEPKYIKAKVNFDKNNENDFLIGEVVLATENLPKPKYIPKYALEEEIKEQDKKRQILP
jgi:hypothetical protein